jgi:hypothetical protein
MKTQQAAKNLAGAVVICEVQIRDNAVTTCSPEWCMEVVNKSIQQSIPRL